MIQFNPVIEDNPNYNPEYPSTMLPIKFFSKGEKLIGTFFKAAGDDFNPTIILLHGFPGNENNFDLAHVLNRSGRNVMIFHYRGSWGSKGKFSWQNCIDDTHSAIEFLRDERTIDQLRIDINNISIIGHSMGGFVGIMTAMDYPMIKNIVSLTGFNFGFFADLIKDSVEIKQYTIDQMKGAADILNGTSPEELLQEMIENKNRWNLINYTDKLTDKNLLIIDAEYDNISPLDIHHFPFISALSKTNTKNVETHILKSGHSFTSKRIELMNIILNWFDKQN